MCQPDLTVEVETKELGGVRGFGTEHQCVEWKDLVDWVSKWEMGAFEEFTEKENGLPEADVDHEQDQHHHGHLGLL